MERPFVSIILPALNEARHIEEVIHSIRPDESANFDHELVVVDGGSTDGTLAIVARMQVSVPHLRLIHNPQRTQAAALNLAAQEADPRAAVLLRADCHAHYSPRFVATCLAALRETGAASVVVTMETVGRTCLQRAIAAAQNSRLGNGGARHRTAGSSGYVDHGHHAAFNRAVFMELGGYSEDMPANEDAELDSRLVAARHKIWLCDEATMSYFPRATFRALAQQYFRYGYGRATTCLRRRRLPKVRQILPLLALFGCLAGGILAPFDQRCLAIPLAYVTFCCGWGVAMALCDRALCTLLAGPAAIVMHIAWGTGFLGRLLKEAGTRITVPQPESRGADSPQA